MTQRQVRTREESIPTAGGIGGDNGSGKRNPQYLVFECVQEDGKELMEACTNQRDYKLGISTVTGATLSLDRLQLPFLSSPTIAITWRKFANETVTTVDEKAVRTVLMLLFNLGKAIWLQKQDSFGSPIRDDTNQNSHSTTTNEELAPTPSAAEWMCIGESQPNDVEIEQEELGEAIVSVITGGTLLSPVLLRTLQTPALSMLSYISHDGQFYRPVAPTREKFGHHLAHIVNTLELGDIPATTILRLLGQLHREKLIG
jgi:hypothetical protein